MNQKEYLKQARELGLDVSEKDTVEAIKEKITAATDGLERHEVALNGPKQGFKRIIIHKQKDDSNKVQVAVQGKLWLIKRGEPVDVPDCVVHALENAVGTSVTMDGDGQVFHNDFMRYPFQYA